VNRKLAQFAEAFDDVKGHPSTSKPASPIVRAQQKNTANDCEKLSDRDPNPIRRATVTEVSNKTADTHCKIKAGDQDYRERNPLTARPLADSTGSVLVHRNLKAPRFALPGNSAPLKAASHQRLTGVGHRRLTSSAELIGHPQTTGDRHGPVAWRPRLGAIRPRADALHVGVDFLIAVIQSPNSESLQSDLPAAAAAAA
jgi:hypothetical protein